MTYGGYFTKSEICDNHYLNCQDCEYYEECKREIEASEGKE